MENDLSAVKANIEALGAAVQVQEFCGITWTDPENSKVQFTDGNPAVGELTADLGDGTLVRIPVCESCLKLVSPRVESYSFAHDLRD
jgi:hypothetical protein